jgi:hypothetical protein
MSSAIKLFWGLVGSTDNGHAGQDGQEILSVDFFTLSAKQRLVSKSSMLSVKGI